MKKVGLALFCITALHSSEFTVDTSLSLVSHFLEEGMSITNDTPVLLSSTGFSYGTESIKAFAGADIFSTDKFSRMSLNAGIGYYDETFNVSVGAINYSGMSSIQEYDGIFYNLSEVYLSTSVNVFFLNINATIYNRTLNDFGSNVNYVLGASSLFDVEDILDIDGMYLSPFIHFGSEQYMAYENSYIDYGLIMSFSKIAGNFIVQGATSSYSDKSVFMIGYSQGF